MLWPAKALSVHPSWGMCWNKSYTGRLPDSSFWRESGYMRLVWGGANFLLATHWGHTVTAGVACKTSKLPHRLFHDHWNQLVLALLQVKEPPAKHTDTSAGKSERKSRAVK